MNKYILVFISIFYSTSISSQDDATRLLGKIRSYVKSLEIDGTSFDFKIQNIELFGYGSGLTFKGNSRDFNGKGRSKVPKLEIRFKNIDKNSIKVNTYQVFNPETKRNEFAYYSIYFETEGMNLAPRNSYKDKTVYTCELKLCNFYNDFTTSRRSDATGIASLLKKIVEKEKSETFMDRITKINNSQEAKDLNIAFEKMQKRAREERKKEIQIEKEKRKNMESIYNIDTMYLSMLKEKVSPYTIKADKGTGIKNSYGKKSKFSEITIPSDAYWLKHKIHIPTGWAKKEFECIIQMDVIEPSGRINTFKHKVRMKLNTRGIFIDMEDTFRDLGVNKLVEGKYLIKYYNEYGTLFTNKITVLSPKKFKKFLKKRPKARFF